MLISAPRGSGAYRPRGIGLGALVLGTVSAALVLISSWPGLIGGGSLISDYAWRLGGVILVVGLMLATKKRFLQPTRFVGVFWPWLAAVFVATLPRYADAAAWLDFLRQVLLLIGGACVYASADSPIMNKTLRAFARFLLIGVLVACLEPSLALLGGGWSWSAARILKGEALANLLGFNTLLFMAAVCLVILRPQPAAFRGWREKASTIGWMLALLVLVAECLVLSVRTPLFVLGIGWLTGTVLSLVFSRVPRSALRMSATVAACLMVVVGLAAVAGVLTSQHGTLGAELAGRVPIWQIGLAAWKTQPVFGLGPNAFVEAVGSHLNVGVFSQAYQRAALANLVSGGFHNIWIQSLVAHGLVGLVGLFISYVLLLRRGIMVSARGHGPLVALILVLFFRSFVESSALFAVADSPLDFIVVVFLAWQLALADIGRPRPIRGRRGPVRRLSSGPLSPQSS